MLPSCKLSDGTGMTQIDIIVECCIVAAFFISAVLTLVRAAITVADIPKHDDVDLGTAAHHESDHYDIVLRARQRRSPEAYALASVELLSFSVGFYLLSSHLWVLFTSVAVESYGFVIVALTASISRVLLSALGERYADKLLEFSTKIVTITNVLTYPFSRLLEKLSKIVAGKQSEEEAREEMEDEITAIMDEAVSDGTLDADEYRILTNIMQFSEVTVRDVMTPRNVVFSLSSDMLISSVVERPELQTYSRIPVSSEQSLDEVIGYCLTRDIYSAALHGRGQAQLSTLLRDVHFIPENVRLDKALEEFLKRRQHLFIVVDEYGGVEGLITMEDVVETILGAEIVDEADRVVDMRQLASLRRDHRIAAAQSISQFDEAGKRNQ